MQLLLLHVIIFLVVGSCLLATSFAFAVARLAFRDFRRMLISAWARWPVRSTSQSCPFCLPGHTEPATDFQQFLTDITFPAP